MLSFKNKTVLITGGSRGIGQACAVAFATAGARVAINFRKNSRAAQTTIESLPGSGHIAVKADISDADEVEGLVTAVVAEFDSLDILINNAGIYEAHSIDEVNYEDWQSSWAQTLAINLTGAANVSYQAVQTMLENGGGRIVNISSRGAFRGEPNHPAYAASKAGLNAMSQSLAKKLASKNIFIGVVAPGFVATDMAADILDSEEGDAIKVQSPLNRVAEPEEVAKAVLFLASEGTEFMTGAILDVNGASYLRS